MKKSFNRVFSECFLKFGVIRLFSHDPRSRITNVFTTQKNRPIDQFLQEAAVLAFHSDQMSGPKI